MNGVDLPLLVEDALCQFLPLPLVLPLIFFVLLQNVIVLLGPSDVPFFRNVQLVQQVCVFFLQFLKLSLELLVSESGRFDVLVHHLLNLNDLLHNFWNFNCSLKINWFDSHLPLHSFGTLQLGSQCLSLKFKFGDATATARMGFCHFLCLLLGTQQLSICLLFKAVQFDFQLSHLLVFSFQIGLQFLYLGNGHLESLLIFTHLVSDMVIFCLFLSYLALVLLCQSFSKSCQFLFESGLPLPVVLAGLAPQILHITVSFRKGLLQLPCLRYQNLIFFCFNLKRCLKVDDPRCQCLNFIIFLIGQKGELVFFRSELFLLDQEGITIMAAHQRYMFSFNFPRSFTACRCRQLYFSRHISRYYNSCSSIVIRVPQ